MNGISVIEERLSLKEYVDFLIRTDLGSQYPRERFLERVDTLLKRASISLSARDGEKLVGVCLAITDFAYWMFITDLGVDREYVKRGIGRRLMNEALKAAGGQENINVYTCANEGAVGFYEKLGMKRAGNDVMEYCHAEWTGFTVDNSIWTREYTGEGTDQ
ncbi:MAG: GNAT family N-acetyltransferase [Clostridia bacterium]|nr:GNAT family N-acetyltransferase [Clostridia bacterium]MBQ4157493.1 GNAT family N-acetyltransferase [Clostridia bacterium]